MQETEEYQQINISIGDVGYTVQMAEETPVLHLESQTVLAPSGFTSVPVFTAFYISLILSIIPVWSL